MRYTCSAQANNENRDTQGSKKMIQVSKKILCVDDQREILDLLGRHLEGHECQLAESGAEGLSLLGAEGPFAVVIADYDMPGMDGISLLRELHERCPDTVPMMLTAHHDLEVAIAALHEGHIFRFLNKPWNKEQLRRCVDQALEQYRIGVSERILARDLKHANEELEQRLKRLQENNRILQQWVEFSPAVIYNARYLGEVCQTSYVSSNLSRLLGFDRTEIIADPGFWYKRVHADDREALYTAIREACGDASGGPQINSYRIQHQDGNYHWIQDAFRVTQVPGEQTLSVTGAWMDISQ